MEKRKRKFILSNDPEKLNSIGVIKANQGDLHQAITLFNKALKQDPTFHLAYYNLGLAYKNLSEYEKAISAYKKAISLCPVYTMSYVNLGMVYLDLELYTEAFEMYKKAIEIEPGNEKALNNFGNILIIMGKYKEAFNAYKEALTINPRNEIALNNMAIALREGGYWNEALRCFEACLKLKPDYDEALGNLVDAALHLLRWDIVERYERLVDKRNKIALKKGLKPGEAAFFNLIRKPDPKDNLKIATAHSKNEEKIVEETKQKLNFKYHNKKSKEVRIKIAYASNGFYDFPTAHNITGVLENHDNNKFDVITYSWSIKDDSPWQKRIKKATKYVDISALNNIEAAKKIYEDKVDILIDLKGHTRGSRSKMMALKPAPILVNLLGFAGSTGANYIDYFVGDKITISQSLRKYFSEKIIYMPDTYWPTDNKLRISNTKYKKADFGLPEDKFIFASFNNAYKIDSNVFSAWMKILKRPILNFG